MSFDWTAWRHEMTFDWTKANAKAALQMLEGVPEEVRVAFKVAHKYGVLPDTTPAPVICSEVIESAIGEDIKTVEQLRKMAEHLHAWSEQLRVLAAHLDAQHN